MADRDRSEMVHPGCTAGVVQAQGERQPQMCETRLGKDLFLRHTAQGLPPKDMGIAEYSHVQQLSPDFKDTPRVAFLGLGCEM